MKEVLYDGGAVPVLLADLESEADGTVIEHKYEFTDKSIYGYGVIPEEKQTEAADSIQEPETEVSVDTDAETEYFLQITSLFMHL